MAKNCSHRIRTYLAIGDQLFDFLKLDAGEGTRNDLGRGSLSGHVYLMVK